MLQSRCLTGCMDMVPQEAFLREALEWLMQPEDNRVNRLLCNQNRLNVRAVVILIVAGYSPAASGLLRCTS